MSDLIKQRHFDPRASGQASLRAMARACRGLPLSPDVPEGAITQIVRDARNLKSACDAVERNMLWPGAVQQRAQALFDALKELETE